MTDGAYITQLLSAVFFLIVGIRLLRLSRRTGETPENLLGIYFFATGLSYLGWLLPTIFHLEAMAAQFDLAAWSLYSVGVVPFMLFIRMAFRPNAAWANWMVYSCTLLLLTVLASWIIQGYVYYALDSPRYWCHWLGYTIPCLWLSVEAFLSHTRANRRTRIGLCDRVVANRYLLFGCFGVFQTFACITDVVSEMESETSRAISVLADTLLGAFEMAGIVMLFLAFFPPAFYQRWIQSAAAGKAEEV